jgi:hypothetical protein
MNQFIKDLQLCGMGNGLVDLQYTISEEKMKDFGMLKGEMRLIDKFERERLLEYFKNERFSRCSGGSAANSVIAFSQLGGSASYKTVLGNDSFGKFYADEFQELGIILKAEFRNDYPTGTCFVFVAPDSERTMLTSLEATAFFGPHNLDEDLIARSEWVYIEGYKFSQISSTEAVFRAVEFAKKYNTKIAFSVSDVFIIDNFYDKVMNLIPDCDLVFCNESEAMALTKTSCFSDACDSLFNQAKNAIITKGPNGSKISWDGKLYEIPAVKTTAIDTTGAGDMFAGAFLYGIINENDPIYAGNLASYCSSRVVSQLGARININFNEIKSNIKKQLLDK